MSSEAEAEKQAKPQDVTEQVEEAGLTDESAKEKVQSDADQDDKESDEQFQMGENVVDVEKMKDNVFFLFPDRNRRLSQFWLLIVLAAIIATTGIIGDSPATVIGAMIVAPLMTPILGTMLSIIVVDGRNFLFSLGLVITGAGSAVLIGYIYGFMVDDTVISKENNSQVAGRVEPKLPDLIGALATGAVAAIALVRKDIAGTLPGVAIAISLVPPLCVAGLSLSSGEHSDAGGALLLFMTNFVSILIVGVCVMYFYRVHKTVSSSGYSRVTAIVIIIVMLAAVGFFLTIATLRLKKTRDIEKCLLKKANDWAEPQGWSTSIVIARENGGKYSAQVYIRGLPPFPSSEDFPEKALVCDADEIELFFFPELKFEF